MTGIWSPNDQNSKTFLKRNVVSHASSPGKLVEVEEKNQELLIPGLEEGSGMQERLLGTAGWVEGGIGPPEGGKGNV